MGKQFDDSVISDLAVQLAKLAANKPQGEQKLDIDTIADFYENYLVAEYAMSALKENIHFQDRMVKACANVKPTK
jgi:hypothetical protein